MKKTIGIEAKNPERKCEDVNCPFHGTLSVRGRIFVGEVTSAKAHKTVTVEWERTKFVPKYERYEKGKSSVKAHNPACMAAKEGDIVKIMECRPLSKTKNFVVVEIQK
jgi:small subunit ribosomal protein S17